MIRNTILACGMVFLVAPALVAPASAHDFWLEAKASPANPADCFNLHVQIGHGEDKQDWPLIPTRVSAFRHVGTGGKLTDIQSYIHLARGTGSVSVCLPDAKDGIFVIESFRAFSQLEAEPFQDYISEEGVVPILIHREQYGLGDQPGREVYSRISKAVATGAASTLASAEPLGLLLEITPLIPPATLQPGTPLPLRVTYRGQPIANATIHVSALDPQIDAPAPLVTGADGVAIFESEDAAHWLFHTVWSEPSEALLMEADYATVFSSLTLRTGS